MAALTFALWAYALNGRWRPGFFVLACIASVVLLVWGVALIFSWVKHRKDESESKGQTGYIIEPSAKRTVIEDAEFHDLDVGIRDGGEDTTIRRTKAYRTTPAEETSHHKVWSFPQMPWRRSKPTDSKD